MQRLISLILTGLLLQLAGPWEAQSQTGNGSMASVYSGVEYQSDSNMTYVPMKQLLKDLEKKFQITFLYHDRIMDNKFVDVRDISLNELTGNQLAELLTDLGLNYTQLDDQTMILTERKVVPVEAIQETITGRVTEAGTGEPLLGVNILIVGTEVGTVTDLDGFFSLEVPDLNATLRFSFIGFETRTIPIDGRTEINVEMSMAQIMGQELVVTGYGTVRTRETVTGSVSAVGGVRLEKVPTANLSNTLAGRVSGFSGVNISGEPGQDNSRIRIRGNATLGGDNTSANEPLIVIDGVPARQGGLDRINPHDVENISILKDASAAIYGSRAANGVILVTTKRGRSGAPQLTVNASTGINQPTVIPEMANAHTYLTMLNEIDISRGASPRRSQDELNRYLDVGNQDPWVYHDTDWFKEGLKPWAQESEASLAISGGTESLRYRVSVRGLTEDAYYRDSATRYNQGEVRSNIDITVTDNIQAGFDLAGRFEDRNFPTQSAGAQFRFLMRGKPHTPARWPDGRPGPDIENGTNPIVSATPATGHHNIDDYYFQSNAYLNIEIPRIEGLGFRGNFAFDRRFREDERWETPWTLYSWDGSTRDAEGNPELAGGPRGPGDPRLRMERRSWQDITFNIVGNYQQNFQNHNFTFLLGTERETVNHQRMGAYREGFITSEFPQLDLGSRNNFNNWGDSSHGARQNYFSRVNYDYQETYLIELVGRFDGSFIFQEGNRYGFFPSVSAGWRLSNEDFFQNVMGNMFNDFTLRASYGRTGNDAVDPFQFLGTYEFSAGYVMGGQVVPTLREARIPNPNITWETADQFNVGLDFSVLDNRLSLEFDYFNYRREGILWQRNAALPLMAGFSLPDENIGKVDSYGFDATLNYLEQLGSQTFLSTTFTLSNAENNIRFFDEPDGIPEWQQNEGRPMNTNLSYRVIGVFQDEQQIANTPSWGGAQPGDLIFEDVNGDGQIDGDDRVRDSRTGMPKWTGGLELNLSHKNWEFTTFWQGAAGAIIYTQTESGEIGNFRADFAENRWTLDNPSTTHPRTWNRADQFWSSNRNSFFIESTDYIRLKSVEVAYSVPASLASSLGVQGARLSVSGFNVLTFTGLKDLDPEANSGGGQYYPQRRSFRAGLTVTF